jgi:hypothetical protein
MKEQHEKHELAHFHQCNLAEDGIIWNHGYDKAVCSCGWKSAASKDQKVLVALFEVHLKQCGEL